MYPLALLASIALPYNQCIDERETVAFPEALVCEEGLSLEHELMLSNSAGPIPRRVRTARTVQRVTKASNKIALEPSGGPAKPAPEGPYLRISGTDRQPVVPPLQIDQDITVPSYVNAGYEVAVPEMDEFEEVDFEEVSEQAGWYGPGYHSHDRLVNVMLMQTIHPGRLQMVILHRTTSPVTVSPAANLIGFDSGLKIGLGLRYGLIEGIDFGLLRVNGVAELFDVYEYDVRLRVVEYDGFATGLRFGLTTFYNTFEGLSSGWFMQIGMEKRFLDRLLFVVNTSYHSNSTFASKTADDVDASCNVGGGIEVQLTDWFAVSADILHTLVGFRKQFPSVAFALKSYSHRHTFALVATNTPQVSWDGLLANTPYGELNETMVGFNVTREFDLLE